jgi:hypothetical protein
MEIQTETMQSEITTHSLWVIPELGDRLLISLGINEVSIYYAEGSWQIKTNSNIKVTIDPPTRSNCARPGMCKEKKEEGA